MFARKAIYLHSKTGIIRVSGCVQSGIAFQKTVLFRNLLYTKQSSYPCFSNFSIPIRLFQQENLKCRGRNRAGSPDSVFVFYHLFDEYRSVTSRVLIIQIYRYTVIDTLNQVIFLHHFTYSFQPIIPNAFKFNYVMQNMVFLHQFQLFY